MASSRSSSEALASSSTGVSLPATSRSPARTIISGIAASMQLASMPPMRSMRRPVGNSDPVTAPQASRKLKRMGAALPATPSIRVLGHLPARCLHRDVDARTRVDVKHAYGGLAVVGLDQALLDRERR